MLYILEIITWIFFQDFLTFELHSAVKLLEMFGSQLCRWPADSSNSLEIHVKFTEN